MNRREFTAGTACAIALASLGLPQFALAQGKKPEDGTDYRKLDKVLPVDGPAGKIEVVEFFWYGCPHCNAFEPLLEAWVKKLPEFASFRRVPVQFREEPFGTHQRIYFALEAMGQLEATHDKLFALFFTDSVRPAGNKPEAMADWVAKAGVDRAKFLAAYQSFGVAGKVKRASQLADLYQVEGTPAVGIAGRFLVPGQAERTLPIVNALIAEARKG